MAYVRVRGNQLAIVHGVREPGTGKVQQQILFTIYSKPEALAIAGSGVNGPAFRFRAFWKQKYPDIKLDWKAVGRAIADHASVLPDHYDYGPERLQRQFRDDLCRFARQLMLTDPQDLATSAQVIQEHRHELEYIANLIEWRLKLRDPEQSEWTADDEYCWRYAMRGWGRDVPPEIEEEAVGFYDRGDYERAAPIFQLLVDCFDRYADGHNYLGLIALSRSDFPTAISRFEKTIELGRRLFPAKIGKKRYWADHDTRPYIRGLRNLTLTLVEAGRFDEAMKVCDRLERECGDIESASWHRATIGLNTRDWKSASEGEGFMELDAARGFLIAFAELERGRLDVAVSAFVQAALRFPRAARMLADKTMRLRQPAPRVDAQDHNTGVSLWRALHAYRRKQSRRAKEFFRTLVRDRYLAPLLDEVIALRELRSKESGREAFDKLHRIQSSEFARTVADRIGGSPRAAASKPDSELVN